MDRLDLGSLRVEKSSSLTVRLDRLMKVNINIGHINSVLTLSLTHVFLG